MYPFYLKLYSRLQRGAEKFKEIYRLPTKERVEQHVATKAFVRGHYQYMLMNFCPFPKYVQR